MESPTESGRTPRGSFPSPVIISPSLKHRQTFIILHGRGSTAEKFSPPLLATGKETLRDVFPHAKIVFPTASSNRAKIYKKSYTHQWFDNWHLEEHTKRQDLMRPGLKKSAAYIHSLLEFEISLVGAKKVVLWGLSQGCATSLASLLTWNGEPFAAVVGMCGWLPFANLVLDVAQDGRLIMAEDDNPFATSGNVDDDLFAHSGDEDREVSEITQTQDVKERTQKHLQRESVKFFRDELDIEDNTNLDFRKIPVFIGHGMVDEKVNIELGREAAFCLTSVGATVKMVEYEGLGHWYSEDMLKDIFEFLKEKLDH